MVQEIIVNLFRKKLRQKTKQIRKMVIELTRYMPVLDAALPVIEEFVRDGEAKIVTSTHPKAIGLALDLDCLLYGLCRLFDTKFIINQHSKEESFQFERARGDGVEQKRLEIELIEGIDFDPQKDGDYVHDTLLITRGNGKVKKISVSAREEVELRSNPVARKLRGYIRLPRAVGKIRLYLRYTSLNPFILKTHYQEFNSLGSYESPSTGELQTTYPVSSSQSHNLTNAAWEFIQLPVFWDARSQWISQALIILSGRETMEERANYYRISESKFRKRIKNAQGICYRIMEASVEGKEFSSLCREINCPVHLEGLFLRKPLKTLRYSANSSTLQSQQVEMLVQRYNQRYATEKDKRHITAEELCLSHGG